VQEADDVIDAVAIDGVARVARLGGDAQDVLDVRVDGDGRHLHARQHHVARLNVTEVEHVADHLGLVVIEGAVQLALVDQDLHFGLRQRRVVLPLVIMVTSGRKPPEEGQGRGDWSREQLQRPQEAEQARQGLLRDAARQRSE
jgi:hypothetical protein